MTFHGLSKSADATARVIFITIGMVSACMMACLAML